MQTNQLNKALHLSLAMLTSPCIALGEEKLSMPPVEQAVNEPAKNPQLLKQFKVELSGITERLKVLDQETGLEWVKKEIGNLTAEAEGLKKRLETSGQDFKKDQDFKKSIINLQTNIGKLSKFVYGYSGLQANPQQFTQSVKGETENGSDFSLGAYQISSSTANDIDSQTKEINALLSSLSAGPGTAPFYPFIEESNLKIETLLDKSKLIILSLEDPDFRKSDHNSVVFQQTNNRVKNGAIAIGIAILSALGIATFSDIRNSRRKSSDLNEAQKRTERSRSEERQRLQS